MKDDIGHILDLTPKGEKMKESLKRLTLTSHTSMGKKTLRGLLRLGNKGRATT